jgi:hypothetical protein
MSISNIVDTETQKRSQHVLPTIGMIVSAQFSVSSFAKRWTHCSQLANYLARFVSANELDPERHSTLLSTFFNEVLEVVYRHQSGNGQISLKFKREGKRLCLSAEVPVDEASKQFYNQAVELVRRPDLDAWYMSWLEQSSEGESLETNAVGLIELAAVYKSVFSIIDKSMAGDLMVLSIDFPYENEDTE